MRTQRVLLSLLVGSLALAWCCSAQAQIGPIRGRAATAAVARPINIQASFTAVVQKQNWPAAKKQEVMAAFNKLPEGMQQAVTASLDPAVAVTLQVSPVTKRTAVVRRPGVTLRLPNIGHLWPASGDGCPSGYVLVYGLGINSNCQVWFNSVARTTHYMPWGADFGECLGFEIPAATAIARDYDLYVKDNAANRSSNHINYRVVASRSWRGNHGWKFANFSEAVIPWEVFRHYFGPDEVEDAVGNHLPAAQAWYDSVYKGVGSGGNCFGMTTRAERTLFWNIDCLYEPWWTTNRQSRAWDYNWVEPQVRRTINEGQASQLEASIMANKLWLLDNQNHNQAWERCRDLIGRLATPDNPVLSIYGPGWGHCVWPYRTEEVGSTRRIIIYDNNVPYQENEPSDPTTVVSINKTTGTVTWNGATRIICRSYADCTPADPHLPTEATDGEAALMNTIVVDKPARVSQIRDENGRTFYADGRIDDNPSTRIPKSMLFIPDTGTSPAADFPAVYVFGGARNKSLDVTLTAVRGNTVRSFAPGLVFEVQPGVDSAQLIFDKILTGQSSLLSVQDGPCTIRAIMRTGARQQRVITISVQQAARGLLVSPTADRSGVNVENRTAAEVAYDLEVQGFQAGAIRTLRLSGQKLSAQTGALLSPGDWAQLLDLRMELRNLQTGARIRSETLRGAR